MNKKYIAAIAVILGVSSASQIYGAELVHRYSFPGDSVWSPDGYYILEDSVGDADGRTYGSAYCSDIYDEFGNVIGSGLCLDGKGNTRSFTEGSFAALPANLISEYASYSVETWITGYGTNNWQRVFDFGSCGINEDGTIGDGKEYHTLIWRNNDGNMRADQRCEGVSDGQIGAGAALPVNDFVLHHVVYTLDGENHRLCIYVDGVLKGSGTATSDLTMFAGDMPNMWIGKSNFGADSYFHGAYDEFRIYKGALPFENVIANYAAGADTIGDPGTFSDFALSVDKTTLYVNERLEVDQSVKFSNVEAFDPSLYSVVTSSDPEVLSVINNNLVRAVAPGTATLTAEYNGHTATVEITVTDEVPELRLDHRYSFDTDANDSVGTAHGELRNGATVADGKLVLNPVSNASEDAQYVKLPPGMMTPYMSATIEIWAQSDNQTSSYNWSRFWEFGNSNGGEDVFDGGTQVFNCTPRGDVILYSTLSTFYGMSSITSSGPVGGLNPAGRLVRGQEYHIVVVADGINKTLSMYCNGVLIKTVAADFAPMDIGYTYNNLIGRSNWAADPGLYGKINEMRIWNGAMTQEDVFASMASGPDQVIDPTVPALENITLTANKTTLYLNERLPISLQGEYADLGSVDIISVAEVSTSDPNVITVIKNDQVRAVGVGTAVITAEYNGQSSTLELTVTDELPELRLDHRYSFESDANDSVGTAHGELRNGATVSDGKLVLAPIDKTTANAQYVKLPPGIIAPYMSATIEMWGQIDNQSQDYNYARFWDFCSSNEGEDVFDGETQRLYLTPRGSTTLNSVYTSPYGEWSITAQGTIGGLDQGVESHIVVVADGVNQTLSMYRDGILIETIEAEVAPMDLGYTCNNLLGRSGFGHDPGLFGKINELRIWSGAMDINDVRINLAAGPDMLPDAIGELESITIALDGNVTSFVEEGVKAVTVYANYENLENVMLNLADVEISSSDEEVVVYDAEGGYLRAMGVGTATVTAVYGEVTGTLEITITEAPPAILTHRYSFDTDITDSVAGANGTLYGAASVADGKLILPGDTLKSDSDEAAHVRLPSNLISECESVTIEMWVTVDELQGWGRVFDFGNKEGTAGTKYMFFAPYNMTVNSSSANFVVSGQGGAEQSLYRKGYYIPTGEEVHVAITVLADGNLGRMYVNGIMVAESLEISNNPAKIGPMEYCYLGRAMYAADPIFKGVLNEFRTWNGAISPLGIAVNTAVGPDSLFEGELGELTDIRIVVDNENPLPGEEVGYVVYADFENLKNVPFNTMDGVVVTCDNPNIDLGLWSYSSPFVLSGNLTVTYGDKVVEKPIAIKDTTVELMHRYSFDDGAYTNPVDSVGGMNGVNYGLDIQDGNLIMTSDIYIELPQGILAGTEDGAITFETWLDLEATTVGDWGSLTISFVNLEDTTSKLGYSLGFQPGKAGNSRNNTSWAVVEIAEGDANGAYYKTETFGNKGLPGNGLSHVVWTIDAASEVMKLYINGRFENQVAYTLGVDRTKAVFENYIGYLGCSRNAVGVAGKMAEFRIWKGVMPSDQVVANYVAGPDVLVDVESTAESITLEAPATVIAGAATLANVKVDFTDAPAALCTDSPKVQLISSDESILTIDSKKRLVGVAAGTATVTAIYNEELETSVEVEVLPEQFGLLHRYSFTDGVKDSVGVADGWLVGPDAIVADGELQLNMGWTNYAAEVQHAYAQIPNGVISGLKSMTWEVWFTPGTYFADWNRMLDFGSCNSSGDSDEYVFVSIYTGAANHRVASRINGSERFYTVTMPDLTRNYEGQQLHMIYTYGENGEVTAYLNGEALASTGSNYLLGEISDNNNYIGRSAYLTDPPISYSMTEFRIWNGVMDAATAAASYAAGPDALPEPAPEEVPLYWSIEDGVLILDWEGGSLEVAESAEGPWMAINVAAPLSIPLDEVSGSSFYRVIR